MSSQEAGLDITRNARTIDWLKAEMVGAAGQTLRLLAAGKQEQALEAMADVVIASYLLAHRLGIPFARLDAKIHSKLEVNVQQKHQVEKWYGDLSKLQRHLDGQ